LVRAAGWGHLVPSSSLLFASDRLAAGSYQAVIIRQSVPSQTTTPLFEPPPAATLPPVVALRLVTYCSAPAQAVAAAFVGASGLLAGYTVGVKTTKV